MKIPRTESKTVEFKAAFNQDSIVSLVAFANVEGGSVYVGVRDDGSVAGVRLSPESDVSWVNEVKSKTAPSIVPDTTRIAVGGKTVVRLRIGPLPVKPASVQGRYYVRKGRSNHLMSIGELTDLHLKSSGSSWDALASEHSLDEVSLEKIAAFARRMNPDSPDDPVRVMRKLSLVRDGKPSNACYLAFAADHCADSLFMAGRFKNATTIVDSQSFSGDLFGEAGQVMDFVKKHLMAGFAITGKPEHDLVYDYPVDAIREIVLNMIVHRDYCALGQNTIKIFDDRIEFSNPGGLPDGVTVEALLSDNYLSRPRNKRLAELFRYAGFIEQYGSGIKRILDACKAHGGVQVHFEDGGTWFKTILRKKEPQPKGSDTFRPAGEDGTLNGTLDGTLSGTLDGTLTQSNHRVLDFIAAHPGCRAREIIAELSIPRDTLNKIIKRLVDAGLVERQGGKKAGGYHVRN